MVTNNEIVDSVKEASKKRLVTPLYGVFTLSWMVFHWELIYAALFVDQDKIWQATGLLKNQYLHTTFFNIHSWSFYMLWLLPIVLTYLIIWIFPKWISIPA